VLVAVFLQVVHDHDVDLGTGDRHWMVARNGRPG
jgi:hypothetical protein